jgi:hypothetical protein
MAKARKINSKEVLKWLLILEMLKMANAALALKV